MSEDLDKINHKDKLMNHWNDLNNLNVTNLNVQNVNNSLTNTSNSSNNSNTANSSTCSTVSDPIPTATDVTNLENESLTSLRVAGILFVLGVALFAFTDKGKVFAIISFAISLLMFIAIIINYFIQKYEYERYKLKTRLIIDIIMYLMIPAILLNAWMLWETIYTEPTSLTQITKDIENQVAQANKVNAQIIQSNLKAIEENRKLITQASEALGFPAGGSAGIEERMNQSLYAHNVIGESLATANKLKDIEQVKGTRTPAVLAGIS